ncbi:MAG: hypothetical protein AB7D05_09580 [Mangrovibacterium sp.]
MTRPRSTSTAGSRKYTSLTGKPDLLQQVEHGTLSLVGVYRSLGRLYRGVICSDLRQYVMLGDKIFSAAMNEALKNHREQLEILRAETPYGIPYRPLIWEQIVGYLVVRVPPLFPGSGLP